MVIRRCFIMVFLMVMEGQSVVGFSRRGCTTTSRMRRRRLSCGQVWRNQLRGDLPGREVSGVTGEILVLKRMTFRIARHLRRQGRSDPGNLEWTNFQSYRGEIGRGLGSLRRLWSKTGRIWWEATSGAFDHRIFLTLEKRNSAAMGSDHRRKGAAKGQTLGSRLKKC